MAGGDPGDSAIADHQGQRLHHLAKPNSLQDCCDRGQTEQWLDIVLRCLGLGRLTQNFPDLDFDHSDLVEGFHH
jgi:hypothetical protein